MAERREHLRNRLEGEDPYPRRPPAGEEGEETDVRPHVEDRVAVGDGDAVAQVALVDEDLAVEELRLAAVPVRHRHAVRQLVEVPRRETPLALQAQPGAERRGTAGLRHQVGHEPAVRRIAGRARRRQHHRLLHAGMAGEGRLDLPELDPQAADLHLVVDPPQEFDLPRREPAHEIAGPVEPAPRLAGRSGHEALGGQLGAAEVAAPHLHPADRKLARDSDRHRLEAGIQQVDGGVGHRPADGHRRPRRVLLAGPEGDVDRRLGRSIEVMERRLGQALEEPLLERRGQGLAARHYLPHAPTAARRRLLQEGLEHRRHEVQSRHRLLGNRPRQARRLLVLARPGHHQAGP